MKRKNAIALGALLSVGLAFLASVTPGRAEPTIYGHARVSIDYVSTDKVEALPDFKPNAWQVNSNNSRVGIRGTKELDHGLSAIYQVEAGVALDAQSTQQHDFWYARNSYVGLKGGWGRVYIGTMDSPYRRITERIDPFHDGMGDFNSILGRTGSWSDFNSRYNNSVNFDSPTIAGFRVGGAWSADREPKDDNLAFSGDGASDMRNPNADYAFSGYAKYHQWPIIGAVAYEEQKSNEGDTSTRAVKALGAFGLGTKGDDGFGTWGKIGAVFEYQDLKDISGTDFDDSHSTIIGFGKYQVGPNQVRAAFGHAGAIKAAPDGYDKGETSANYWAAGYEYKLQKRTGIWLEYAGVSNGDAADYGLGQVEDNCYHYNPYPGNKVNSFSLGMRTNF